MFQVLFSVVAIGLGVAAGLWELSFWWAVGVSIVAGSLATANKSYDLVMRANRAGSLTTMPVMIAAHTAPVLGLAALAYWIAC